MDECLPACEARTRWTADMEDVLVDMWQYYECLYNVASETFHNKVEKRRSWEQIAMALDLPVKEVKVRAVSLRTQYSKLLKQVRRGSDIKDMTERQRRILTSLEFLKNYICHRTSTGNLGQSVQDMLTAQEDSNDMEPENGEFSLERDSAGSEPHTEASTVGRTGWTVQKEDKLLTLWQQHECLYKLSSDKFHDRHEKEKKWAEIATALELPVEDVKTRANSLRTQYSKLVKPQYVGKKAKPSTPRQKRILKSLDFLKNHINHRYKELSLDQSTTRPDDTGSDPDDAELSQDFDCKPSPSPSESSSVSPPCQRAKKRPKTQSSRDVEGEKLALLQHLVDVIQAMSGEPERDCDDSFGATVATELKRIQSSVLKNKVKKQIMTVLYDALDCETPSVSSLQPTPSPKSPTQ